MSWVWESSRAEGIDRLVLLAVADHASDDGRNAYPSVRRLAEKTKVSTRTVQRALASLVRLGELRVKANAGQGGANVYTVVMTPRQADTPDRLTPPRQADTPSESRPPRQPDTTPPVTESPPPRQADTQTVLEPSEEQKTSSSEPSRLDVERLCVHLADRIQRNGSKRPEIGKRWRDAARLMIDTDKRTEQQVHNAIDWCQDSEFWRANILSMPKLREKYDALRLAAARPTSPPKSVEPPRSGTFAHLRASTDW